ncbi:hypothetical protein AC792_08610 [Arthrobacter sp. RIT-PI-e]|nr:hypothetical protein AC792_08610 [Arthrobacter sp. RIT-PI-e]
MFHALFEILPLELHTRLVVHVIRLEPVLFFPYELSYNLADPIEDIRGDATLKEGLHDLFGCSWF